MKRIPFSLFKRASSRCYYVKFKNNETGKYLPAISTKQESEAEAMKIAFEWLTNGIPKSGETVSYKQFSLRDMTKAVDISKEDAAFICKELQRRGLLKSYVLHDTKKAIDFSEFLLNFWDWDNSPYIKEKLRKKHSIHRSHAIEMTGTVKKYWIPFFKDKLLGEITRQDIEGFIVYLESLEEKAQEEQAMIDKAFEEKAIKEQAEIAAGLRKPKRKNAAIPKRPVVRFPKSGKRKNTIIQAGSVPLAWAFHKEIIDRNVTAGITWFSGTSDERQILSPEQAAALFRVEWNDERARLANMLAMVTGMREGEIQGLRVQDLGKEFLFVRHSWNFQDGLKPTKNNENRVVEVPFPTLMNDLFDLAGRNPHTKSMDGYVFWAEILPDKPMEQDIFLREFKTALVKSGLSKESADRYTFHGWRHYFASYMRPRITEKLLKSQTGHKTLQMLNHYSGHIISGDRERIRQAQLDVFSRLLPDNTVNYKVVGE
jgi:integrase